MIYFFSPTYICFDVKIFCFCEAPQVFADTICKLFEDLSFAFVVDCSSFFSFNPLAVGSVR